MPNTVRGGDGCQRWVCCERFIGIGEIIRSRSVGPYQQPDEYAEICEACGGAGGEYQAGAPPIQPSRGCCPHGYHVDMGGLCPICDS